MTSKAKLAAGLVLLGLSLAACGGGGGGGGGGSVGGGGGVTPPPAARFESQFGGNFGTAYQASPNSEPRDVAAGDAIAVSTTAEPVALPGT